MFWLGISEVDLRDEFGGVGPLFVFSSQRHFETRSTWRIQNKRVDLETSDLLLAVGKMLICFVSPSLILLLLCKQELCYASNRSLVRRPDCSFLFLQQLRFKGPMGNNLSREKRRLFWEDLVHCAWSQAFWTYACQLKKVTFQNFRIRMCLWWAFTWRWNFIQLSFSFFVCLFVFAEFFFCKSQWFYDVDACLFFVSVIFGPPTQLVRKHTCTLERFLAVMSGGQEFVFSSCELYIPSLN